MLACCLSQKPQEDIPESTFQATFETLDNEWKDIEIPWHEFLPVKRSNYEPSEPPIDLSTVKRFALVCVLRSLCDANHPNAGINHKSLANTYSH